jgi:hypothetical protein
MMDVLHDNAAGGPQGGLMAEKNPIEAIKLLRHAEGHGCALLVQ